jgi:hypothetical protein
MSATSQEEASDQQRTTRTSQNDGSTGQLFARDPTSKDTELQKNSPASAAAVNAVMGSPPPKDEKTGSRWERWRRDRKEAKELGMPSQESTGRWGVNNFAA